MYTATEPSQHMYSVGMGFNKSYLGGINRENTTTGGGSYLETAAAARAGVEASAAQPRRRSHRPRGCRGGRKNRKNRERNAAAAAAAATGSSVALSALATSKSQPNSNTAHTNINHTTKNSPLKGDLSNYQFVNTGKAWGGNHHSPLPKSDHSDNTNSPMKRQMLPPPLPPFLNGQDPFVEKKAKEQADDQACLKMLPSFDERELTAFLSAPVASSSTAVERFLSTSAFQQPLDLRHLLSGSDGIPIGTVISSSGSGSDDDYTSSSTSTSQGKNQRIEMQRQQELESGSLFVTSPRSFLLGAPSSSHQSHHEHNISVW